jgi:hypothetical protein
LRTFNFKAKNFSNKGLNKKKCQRRIVKGIRKNYSSLIKEPTGVIRAEKCAIILEHEKIKKSIFSIDKANISHYFLLDKLYSGQD